MSAINLINPHKHVVRGEAGMEETPKKAFQYGNTTVIIHSPLVLMTVQERKEWFKNEWEKGNPILKEIAAAVEACYRN
ncbi:hypothetical protein [Neobacillus sp. PS3-40]|uniref:hypothetical protein n=1 Tax=Neobacillus sp. PS3-40 TaxID=3070679 RepID=UPI0027E0C945|nr:hypothetical protein [Neobacillus sp. PS3-40]WML43113.1 hypothetical protein RCG20_15060 [Neobacillus sp. PS3-40]